MDSQDSFNFSYSVRNFSYRIQISGVLSLRRNLFSCFCVRLHNNVKSMTRDPGQAQADSRIATTLGLRAATVFTVLVVISILHNRIYIIKQEVVAKLGNVRSTYIIDANRGMVRPDAGVLGAAY